MHNSWENVQNKLLVSRVMDINDFNMCLYWRYLIFLIRKYIVLFKIDLRTS